MIDYDELHPECLVCNKPIDKFMHYNNFRDCTITFIAECHGMREEVALYPQDLEPFLRSCEPVKSVAFSHKELLHD